MAVEYTWDATDWAINRATKVISYEGDAHVGTTPRYITTILFHREVGKLADDAVSSGDDEYDMTDLDATDRDTDDQINLVNGYTLDDGSVGTEAAWEHLYAGSIVDGSGTTLNRYSGFQVVGTTNKPTQPYAVQDGAVLDATPYWGTDLAADATANILCRGMIPTILNGCTIDGGRVTFLAREFLNTSAGADEYREYTLTLGLGEGVVALTTQDDINSARSSSTVAAETALYSNLTAAYNQLDVDGNTVDENYYSEWDIIGAGTKNGLFEFVKELTRREKTQALYGTQGQMFRGITHEIDYDNASGTIDEGLPLMWGTEVAWDTPLTTPGSVGQYYHFSGGAKGKLLALDNNTTDGFAIFAIQSGTPADNDTVTRADGTANDGFTVNVTVNDPGVGGGYGVVLANDDTDTLWIQLLSGVAPADNLTMWETTAVAVYDNATGAKADCNEPSGVQTRAVPANSVLGTYTGSDILGGYGVGIVPADLGATDSLTALDNTARNPQNNVTFTVSGLNAGDSVLVGPGTSNYTFTQMATDTSLTGVSTTVSINPSPGIPSDTPTSGTIRIERDSGNYSSHPFSVRDLGTDTFTITSHDFTSDPATSPANVWISYIDTDTSGTSESVTLISPSARDLFIKVREGSTPGSEIKTFQTTASVTTDTTVNAIRTDDF
jgi:hypothetical protein